MCFEFDQSSAALNATASLAQQSVMEVSNLHHQARVGFYDVNCGRTSVEYTQSDFPSVGHSPLSLPNELPV